MSDPVDLPGLANLPSVTGQKAALRAAMKARLKAMPASWRHQSSQALCNRLSQNEIWRQASSILFYSPLSDEVDISSLMEIARAQAKTSALPQFQAETGVYRACQLNSNFAELALGRFGIREPSEQGPGHSLNRLDLMIIPGVAFDLSGHRLGRGKGFYDRLLGSIHGLKCGVAFDEQLQPQIPVEAHDILLDCIMTPTRWLDFRSHRPGDDFVG